MTALPCFPVRVRALTPLFAATMFVSAGLLFWIQPLFSKMILPMFGGAPAVWNTAMMFFQAMLLLGYGYVYCIDKWLSPRLQVIAQAVVMAIAFASLPIAVLGGYEPGTNPVMSLITLLAMSIGLPFFAISATAPLLQRWFAHADHPQADDPYFLYGASNLGSILALVAFPLLLEPQLSLREQGIAWSGLFAALFVMMGFSAFSVLKNAPPRILSQTPQPAEQIEKKMMWRQRLRWTALAFAPSSLLLGVTQHISTDVAAAPLLWVLPLILYLLTYVIVFARQPLISHRLVVKLQPYFLILGLIGMQAKGGSIQFSVTMHLSVFFILALSCHSELVNRRPGVLRLTEFYLCMSIGGLLGGIFNVLVAPVVFDGIYEYGLAIMAIAIFRPGVWKGRSRDHLLDFALPLAILLIALAVLKIEVSLLEGRYEAYGVLALWGAMGVAIFGFQDRPLRFGLGVGALLLASAGPITGNDYVVQERSFFGVYRVKLSTDGLSRNLYHGTTLHGAQLMADADKLEPTTYYSRQGPLGQLFRTVRSRRANLSVGLVGLGIGSTLCYARPGDRWTVFEIDPLVIDIAKDDRYFTLVRDCAKDVATRFQLGDARLGLQAMANGSFDLLVLDAYSSDAIPIHLLNREALALYRSKLTRDGVMMFHISNRHLNLDKVMSALVRDTGLAAYRLKHVPGDDALDHARASHWIAVANDVSALSALPGMDNWEELPQADLRPWTDDYSNILDVLR